MRDLTFTIFLAAASGCLLSEPINVEPTVTITGPQTLHRGETPTFVAIASDGDAPLDSLRVDWGKGSICPPTLEMAKATQTVGRGLTFALKDLTLGPICVWAVATDTNGASALATLTAKVENRVPVARIALPNSKIDVTKTGLSTGPTVPLYAMVHLSGATSLDPDPDDAVSFQWSLTDPANQAARPVRCAEGPNPEAELCFSADLPGVYTATLLVADESGSVSEPAHLRVQVRSDGPPCIVPELTRPRVTLDRLIKRPGEIVKLEVGQVRDDGDPSPPAPGQATQSSFMWSFRPGKVGSFQRLGGVSLNFFQLSDEFRSGDIVQVRVEYEDRINRETELATCRKQDVLLCAIEPMTTCYQAVTWTVEYL